MFLAAWPLFDFEHSARPGLGGRPQIGTAQLEDPYIVFETGAGGSVEAGDGHFD